LSLHAETVHPTRWSFGKFPLALVAQFGNTTFLGDDRDGLGFEYFFEAGLALETDITQELVEQGDMAKTTVYTYIMELATGVQSPFYAL
jgi:hypothetical protein